MLKLTDELEAIVSMRTAVWDPQGSAVPELMMRVDGKLVVVALAGVGGLCGLGDVLEPLCQFFAEKRVSEYALIFTGREFRPQGPENEWVVHVIRGNVDGQELMMNDQVLAAQGRVPDALAVLVRQEVEPLLGSEQAFEKPRTMDRPRMSELRQAGTHTAVMAGRSPA